MRPASKVASVWRRSANAALLASLLLPQAPVSANDVANALTLGQIKQRGAPPRYYLSDSIDGALSATDSVELTFNASATHYQGAADTLPSTVLHVGLGMAWNISEHLTLEVEAFMSPLVTRVTLDPVGGTRQLNASFNRGLNLDVVFDPELGTSFNSTFELGIAGTQYGATESLQYDTEPPTDSQSGTLMQLRMSAELAATLLEDNELQLSASYFSYQQSSQRGPGVLDATSLSDGLPMEPLQYSLRADLARRFGPLRLSVFGQFGQYTRDQGDGTQVGARLQVKLSQGLRAWASARLQRVSLANAPPLTIPGLSAGFRVLF